MRLSLPEPNRRIGVLDALGMLGLAALLVGRFIPVARLIPFWGCAFRKVTGWPCPGCGLTRAVDFTAHLQLVKALQANPLGTLAIVAFGVMGLYMVLHLAFRVPVPELVMSEREWKVLRYGVIAVAVLNYGFVIVQHRAHPWS